jgi:hypothetical protein
MRTHFVHDDGTVFMLDDDQPIYCTGQSLGDYQVSGEYSGRLYKWSPDQPGHWAVTDGTSAVERLEDDDDGSPRGFVISEVWATLLCTNPADPGGTEVDSEYNYEGGDIRIFNTAKEAEAALYASFKHSWNQIKYLAEANLL